MVHLRVLGDRAIRRGADVARESLGLAPRWRLGRLRRPGRPRKSRFTQIRWGEPPPGEPTPASLLSVTDAYWRGWVSPPDAPLRRVAARWHPWVERSELVLKLLSYSDSGVFVAAPTTSLPEMARGVRNRDYRYVWIRDAAFTAQVFLLLGHLTEARAYVGWAFDRAARLQDGEDLRTIYTVDGGAPPKEVELSHLDGYQGSRPVRVGERRGRAAPARHLRGDPRLGPAPRAARPGVRPGPLAHDRAGGRPGYETLGVAR